MNVLVILSALQTALNVISAAGQISAEITDLLHKHQAPSGIPATAMRAPGPLLASHSGKLRDLARQLNGAADRLETA
ncbi:MAG: hypothetical protein KGL39_35530 [Patescibacteria group bacterium]|nr:hypothetical protein [Patescibacteria group bacterium]